jgi:hypothetical protein
MYGLLKGMFHMRFMNLFVAVASLICLVTCDSRPRDSSSRELVHLKPDFVMLNPVSAVIRESEGEAITLVQSNIAVGQDFKSLQFINSNEGWAAASSSLYKTV